MNCKVYDQGGLMPAQSTLVAMVQSGSRVLEVGCATGYVTRVLVEQRGCRVTAVEISEDMAAGARRYADRVIVGDICEPETWARLGREYKHVIFADVLEHLSDPWDILRRTTAVLGLDGSVIASIPNVAHYRIRLKLLLGKFEYRSYGILDDTHLRFFTCKSARELFTSSGYTVTRQVATNWRPIERLMTAVFPCAFAVQFVIKAQPCWEQQ